MNVGKAWHYLLIHPEKGYYTGYKGREAFGDLESARIYRTEQEAYMARLRAGLEVRVESCLLWHSSRTDKTEDTAVGNRTISDESNSLNKTRQSNREFRLISGYLDSSARSTAKTYDKTHLKPQTQLKLIKSS